jgi:copper chaperone
MIESASIIVTGMKCGGCETTVKNTVQALDGVLLVNASIKASITNAGFNVQ